MKILSISGRNLNSLRADFTVDFTNGALKDCGIFAITGPTGAGKTTLLDAITLALYGRTPRSANDEDIISYGAGEARAEVIFQTAEGCFKSEWKVRRARKKHDGVIQQSEMEVSTYPDRIILTQKKREAQDKVKELIRLEYDQFLKSVLLAQGAFKAFLDAREGERGEMLEKISDTSLYTKLSKRAFERKKKEEQKLDNLWTSVGNVVILTDEERLAHLENINKLKDEEQTLQKELAEHQIKFNWLKSISELTQKHLDAEKELELARQRLQEERPNLQRWEAHQQVAGLEILWMQYESKREESILQQLNINKLREKLLLLSQSLGEAEILQGKAQTQLEAAIKDREVKMPVILGAITRLADLRMEKKQLAALHEKLQAKILEEAGCKSQILKKQVNLVNDKKIQAELETWIDDHRQYAEAANSCTQASLLVSQLKRTQADIESTEATILKIEKQITFAKNQIQEAEKNEQQSEKDQQILSLLHDSTVQQLSKFRSQLIVHEQQIHLLLDKEVQSSEARQNELARQEFLAEHLSRLHEGEPCPLCGSAEHPNQTISVIDVQKQISHTQLVLKKHRDTIKTNKALLKTIDRLLANLEEYPELEIPFTEPLPENFESVFNELIQLQRSVPQKQNEAMMMQASSKQLKVSVTGNITDLEISRMEIIQKLGFDRETVASQISQLEEIALQYHLQFDVNSPAKLADILKKYSDEYHTKSKEQSVLSGTIPGIQTGIEMLTTQIHVIINDIAQFQQEIETKNLLIKNYTAEINSAYSGYASPEAARDQLNADEKLANEQLKKSSEQLNRLKNEIGKTNGELESNEKNLNELTRAIEILSANLKAGLVELELEADFVVIEKQLLLGNERSSLQRLHKSLNEKLLLSESYAQSCKKQLELQLSLDITKETEDIIIIKMQQFRDVLKEISEKFGRLKQILSEDDAKQVKIQAVKKEIESQEIILEKWAALSGLIGSESGKKFNQFAQGLTLDRLIAISNHHLQLLNDRYLVKRNTVEQGLRLLIVDKYQADNEREVNTLSGGESFLVSLALALGLSEMTSKLTTIDSLFIDEGFGTLDADTLEVALSALRGLQISGKTIGIISHVERLKEEIYTQVEITKGPDGFSTLKVIPEIV